MTRLAPGYWQVALGSAAMVWSLAISAPTYAVGVEPPPGLTHYRCYICHADRETLVGPAFEDVARVHRGKADAVSKIASDIRGGIRGGGPWHMPPHPEVSPEEARAMARYIMSLEPAAAVPRKVDRR